MVGLIKGAGPESRGPWNKCKPGEPLSMPEHFPSGFAFMPRKPLDGGTRNILFSEAAPTGGGFCHPARTMRSSVPRWSWSSGETAGRSPQRAKSSALADNSSHGVGGGMDCGLHRHFPKGKCGCRESVTEGPGEIRGAGTCDGLRGPGRARDPEQMPRGSFVPAPRYLLLLAVVGVVYYVFFDDLRDFLVCSDAFDFAYLVKLPLCLSG